MSAFDLRTCSLDEVRQLCEQFHGYGSAGGVAVSCFGVYESGRIVAAYAWQPPPPGAALSVCSEAPGGVLALSRMVAVPKDKRRLAHVSKPLRQQMTRLLDRKRWPVLVTYSDEGQGHTGHVYKCSGWEPTQRAKRAFFTDKTGARVSSYSAGRYRATELERGGWTFLQRWEHWVCARGEAGLWMALHGWHRRPVPGRVWRSGKQAHEWFNARADSAGQQ